ncbi:MAG TPA: pyridoxal-phosphate dependent enzyme, partial [Acidimicrobiia bacterium]|nr:pyridoxal-phosphate dependent enzyme [Acidimicrobiia bacterium]
MPPLKVQIQPGGRTLVNVDTIFYTDPTHLRRTVTLLGHSVRLDAAPVRYTWVHGDGTRASTSTPGRPYPAKDVTHQYRRPDDNLRARVDTTYRVRYSVDGAAGPTWRRRSPRQDPPQPSTSMKPRPSSPADPIGPLNGRCNNGQMRIANHIIDLVGNTPLVKLTSVVPAGSATVAAKIEYLNPGGSVKDRIAVKMVDDAEKSGALKPGGTIIEPTSGNTGVGLALVAQQRGYHCIFVCPDKVSLDKQNTLRAYGAEVVVCPTAVPPDHPDSYYAVSDRLVHETDGGWKPDQYSNPAGPESHYETTGPEIWNDTDGQVTHFVAGVGTGGTITGAGRYLKEVSEGRVKVVGVDPEGSVYSGGSGRPYLVEGVGEDFWPSAYDPDVPDEIIAVSDADSFEMT